MEFGGEEGTETSPSSSHLCQCRICHEGEEEESKTMEAPCSCSGSLKFAHRGCIQRWCHEKGSTICEICLQKFEPGYTLPPKVPQFVDMVVTIRGNLEAPQLNYQLEAISSGDEAVYEHPECSPSSRRGALCYRYVALAVTIVLLFKHYIDVTTVKASHYPFTLETVLLLRWIGILLPFYLAMRIITAIQRAQRRHQLHERDVFIRHEVEDAEMQQYTIQIHQ